MMVFCCFTYPSWRLTLDCRLKSGVVKSRNQKVPQNLQKFLVSNRQRILCGRSPAAETGAVGLEAPAGGEIVCAYSFSMARAFIHQSHPCHLFVLFSPFAGRSVIVVIPSV